ncbi:MAG TPA: 5-guanidino-2-oxopentanoate decarboxylase [Steroidobacteraceae bacterium]|nr:5-guanidino-2-oxopentanoate decarboxylase [Steroidobacteraceae bacterium]
MTTLGQYLVEALDSLAVGHVFGIPGVHNLELYRALPRSRLRHVTGRHEQGLGFMADGYARACGRPGVCFTITGPGLTNIATAMGQAYQDSIPMLVISSQNRRDESGGGRGFLHELPGQATIAREISGFAQRISAPDELPDALTQAFRMFAVARPRPAYIEIPRDLLASRVKGLALPATQSREPARAAAAAAVGAAVAALNAARRPVVLAGGGAIGAAAEVHRIAEGLDAPVVMTVNGRGILPPDHPLAVPYSPSLAPVRALIAAADVVLAVGTELGPTDYDMYGLRPFPPPAQLLRIDIDEAQTTCNAAPAVALTGDARATLEAILGGGLGSARRRSGASRAAAACGRSIAALTRPMRAQIDFLEVIRENVPGALLVGDSTQPVYAGNLGFAAATPGSWFNSATGFGSLGYALPASTGASLGAPGRPVVCLVGDGGLQFTLGELGVPRDVEAWVAIVVWNNRSYSEIRTSMVAAGIEPSGVEVVPPDFALLARAYGYAHRRIGSLSALRKACRSFAKRRQVVMFEIKAEAFE